MLKNIFLILVLSVSTLAHATQQEPDYIMFEGKRCELDTSWVFPSPLQAYFIDDETRQNPFEVLSTANYRGHIAEYEILEDSLYLVRVSTENTYLNEQLDDEEKAQKERKEKDQSKKLIKNIFPSSVDKNGKVFAGWFSGNLRIFSNPVMRLYRETNEDEGYEIQEFTEITLLQISNGKVIRKRDFPVEEYWSKFNTYLEYRKMDPADIQVFKDHSEYIDNYTEGWEDIGSIEPEGAMHTEVDFSVFLTRRISRDVRIPLSDFSIVENATIDFSDKSYVLPYDFLIENDSNLLFLEMGSTNIPLGPWSPYTGGSVQLVIGIGVLESKTLKLTEKNTESLKFINNFTGLEKANKKVSGSLQVDVSDSGEVFLIGVIELITSEPETFQEFNFDGEQIPVKTVREYIKTQYGEDDDIPLNVEEVYKEVLENSKAD